MTTRNFRVKNGLSVGDITISASANTITGLATAAPSADGDVANKKYVDDQINAISTTSITTDGNATNATVSGTGASGVLTITANSNEELTVNDSGMQLGGSGARVNSILDEDNMATDSATALATQQSIKAYVDTAIGNLSSTTIQEGNTTLVVADSGSGTITATVDGATVATFQGGDLALPNNVGLLFGVGGEKIESDGTDLTITSTGALQLTVTGTTTVSGALTVSGDLTVNGTTTTVNSTNTTLDDNLLELNSGAASNANDSGIIIERGSTGDNAIFMWDESADKFTLGTTTATASSTGDITITAGTLVAATFEGNLTGAVTGNADTATKWATGRTITLTGDVTGTSGSFDGSGNLSFATTIAANSVALGTDTTGNYVAAGAVSGNGLSGSASAEGATFTVTSNATSANTASTIVFRDGSGNFSAGTITANLTGTATAAQYSDVAERFASDSMYEPGTVVALGGAAEITAVAEEASDEVFGVISGEHQAAFKMNGAAGSDATHPYVAMTGRVDVKVIGSVNKGDRLISASVPGYARAATKAECTAFNVIGRALSSKQSQGAGSVLAAVRVSH